ncbi:MAG: response regulator [Myxococcota bacterium]
MDPFTLLVVEGEFLIRWAVGERLAEEGCRVVEAEDVHTGRRRFREGCDGVLLDLDLPDVAGRDLLREFRGVRPGTPVVMMSAHCSPRVRAALVGEGAWGFVPKPFDLEEVVRLVARLRESRLAMG